MGRKKKEHSKSAIQKADTGQLSIESKVCGLLEYPTSNLLYKTETSLSEILDDSSEQKADIHC